MMETVRLDEGKKKQVWIWRWGIRKQSSSPIPNNPRPMKRANSKDRSPLGVDPTTLRIHTFSGGEIERMLRGNAHNVQKTALRALTIARCPESLACLYLLFQVEDAKTKDKAAVLYARLVKEYAAPDADLPVERLALQPIAYACARGSSS
ncbi:hypothetical protein BASA81_001993 [Batrachochytrium salamandrivorans]|nr:hypothetical protein BASA81_001993 [Batrachochytrium salamandrivorans]